MIHYCFSPVPADGRSAGKLVFLVRATFRITYLLVTFGFAFTLFFLLNPHRCHQPLVPFQTQTFRLHALHSSRSLNPPSRSNS